MSETLPLGREGLLIPIGRQGRRPIEAWGEVSTAAAVDLRNFLKKVP